MAGEEETSGRPLSILFAGDEENKNYLARLAYGGSCLEKHLGKTWLWSVSRKATRQGLVCTLAVTEIPWSLRRLYHKKGTFCVPSWIRGEVDVSAGVVSLIDNESLRSDLRKVHRNGLTFEVTNEMGCFQRFYHHMYLPYISKAHGNTAFISGYDDLARQFRHCDLLLVKKADEIIAGMMLLYERKGARLLCLGISGGDVRYVQEGAIAALYYYSISYLHDKGYAKVSLGSARAFLKDGVLHYKKKWHPTIGGPIANGLFVDPMFQSPGVKGFLVNNPFVFRDGEGFSGAVFVDAAMPIPEDGLRDICKKHGLAGMTNLFVYRYAGDDVLERVLVNSGIPQPVPARWPT
jgi:hypothetical protein